MLEKDGKVRVFRAAFFPFRFYREVYIYIEAMDSIL